MYFVRLEHFMQRIYLNWRNVFWSLCVLIFEEVFMFWDSLMMYWSDWWSESDIQKWMCTCLPNTTVKEMYESGYFHLFNYARGRKHRIVCFGVNDFKIWWICLELYSVKPWWLFSNSSVLQFWFLQDSFFLLFNFITNNVIWCRLSEKKYAEMAVWSSTA